MHEQQTTCLICGQQFYVQNADGPSWAAKMKAHMDQVTAHVEQHSEIELAQAKLRLSLDQMNPGERVVVARDVYRALARPDDRIGCYTIDEALGSVTMHNFYLASWRKEHFDSWRSAPAQETLA